MKWTVSALDEICRGCGATIPADAPIALLTSKALVRWERCAPGPVDAAEVDRARFALEQQRLQDSTPQNLSQARPTARTQPVSSRRMSPLSSAAAGLFDQFDPKAAAAGRQRRGSMTTFESLARRTLSR